MSLRELQTSAARVLHVERPTDQSVDTLRQDFGYHPLDIEAVFSAAHNSSFTAFGTYAYLTWLWPEPKQDQYQEIRIFVDANRIVIIGDTPSHTIRHFVEKLKPESIDTWQQSAPELVHDVLRVLADPLVTEPIIPSLSITHRLSELSVVIRQFGRWLQTNQLSRAVPLLILDAHRLDSLVDRYRMTATVSAMEPAAPPVVPRLVGIYALASVVMVVLVLVTLSIQSHV